MTVDIARELLNAETLKVLGFLLALFAISTFAIVRSVFPFVKGLATMGIESFEKAWAQMVSVQEDVTKALQNIRDVLSQNTQALRENTERIERIESYLLDRVERVVKNAIHDEIKQHEERNRRRRFLWW